jgi:hypothetical protein
VGLVTQPGRLHRSLAAVELLHADALVFIVEGEDLSDLVVDGEAGLYSMFGAA